MYIFHGKTKEFLPFYYVAGECFASCGYAVSYFKETRMSLSRLYELRVYGKLFSSRPAEDYVFNFC